MDKSFYIIIPAYNAAEFLAQLVEDLTQYISLNQILIVNDGSKDTTGKLVPTLGTQFLNHSVNQGKAQALCSGFEWGLDHSYKWAITMDADGQHACDDLSNFITKLKQINEETTHLEERIPADVGALLGARNFGETMPKSRVFSNATTTKVLENLAGQKLWDSQCGYRAYSLNALNRTGCLKLETRGFQWESEVLIKLAWSGYLFQRIPVQTIYNEQGSHISHFKDTLRFVQMWLRLLQEKRKYHANY